MAKRSVLLVVVGILIYSVLLVVQFEDGDFLRGPDAYYYALQADFWARTGDVKIPDVSIIHRLTGSLQLSGLKTETAIHIWIGIAYAILCLLTVYLGRQAGTLAMLGITSWLLISPSLIFVAIEFPKFFLFLLCLPVALSLIRLDAPRNLYAIAPLLLAVVMHRAALPISLLISCIVLLQNYQKVIINRTGVIMLVGAGFILVSLYLLLGDRFSFLDLERLGGLTHLSPGILTLLGRDALPFVIKLEIITLLICLVLAIVIHFRKYRKFSWNYLVIFSLVLPGFFPFSNLEVFGVGERYAILLPYLFSISIIMLLPKQAVTATLKPVVYFISIVVITYFLPYRVGYSHPDYLDPDYETYDTVTRTIEREDIPMLIAHRGLNFYYKFKTHKESFHYEPEPHWDKKRIWRLAHRISADELSYYLQPPCNWSDRYIKSTGHRDYFLIREDCWFTLRAMVTEEIDQDLHARLWQWWKNPAEKRPAFLYRKHRQSGQEQDDEFSAFRIELN